MIVLISHIFPKYIDDTYGSFVKNTADAIYKYTDSELIVVSPIPLHRLGDFFRRLKSKSHGYKVLSPIYFSFPAKNVSWKFGQRVLALLTLGSFSLAVWLSLLGHKRRISAIYGHFFYLGGMTASLLGKVFKVNSYVFNGEDSFWSTKFIGVYLATKILNMSTGIILPSNYRSKELSKEFPELAIKRQIVLPNGADIERFRPLDQAYCRSKLGISVCSFVSIFVGTFDQRKGFNVALDAVRANTNCIGLFLGGGHPNFPVTNRIKFSKVPNNELPIFYNSADVFIFPTRSEGSPNAMVEAICCGLPVLSSDEEFLDDLLDETNSIRFNHDDVEGFAAALSGLQLDATTLARLKAGSLEKAKTLSLEKRVHKLLKFMV